MTRLIYADHAATTALSDTALKAMTPYFQQQYGNPSSLYRFAQEAKSDLEQARAEIAACNWGPSPRRSTSPPAAPRRTTGP